MDLPVVRFNNRILKGPQRWFAKRIEKTMPEDLVESTVPDFEIGPALQFMPEVARRKCKLRF